MNGGKTTKDFFERVERWLAGFREWVDAERELLIYYNISRPSINNTEYTYYERVAVNRDAGKWSCRDANDKSDRRWRYNILSASKRIVLWNTASKSWYLHYPYTRYALIVRICDMRRTLQQANLWCGGRVERCCFSCDERLIFRQRAVRVDDNNTCKPVSGGW